MKKKIKNIHPIFVSTGFLPRAVLGIGLVAAVPIVNASIASPDEVIVTARRTEEVIQNVPISMTVFNQEMLNERNVTSGADLVAYTPSLNINSRFGSDQASFAIRGFTQDLRTTASVAVYFADVVAPRGSGNITSGDGAGPGAFFDLQNVQVLKGPQGTLFGRNTTGGAIQLVPQEPTDNLEGYAEVSAGNYGMRREQGVINVPLTDKARARFGIDTQRRDGYVVNVSGIGPSRFSNVDYLAGRGSLILDITDTVQNYTIFSHTHSDNNGSIQGLIACNTPGIGFAAYCRATLNEQGAGFYDVVSVDSPNPVSELKQWQAINKTTWAVTDGFELKNILSYAHLKQNMRTSTFGSDYHIGAAPLQFSPAGNAPGVPSNSQETYVEELQASGTALDSKLTWQAGLYYESSRPDGWSGAMGPGYISCYGLPLDSNPANWTCSDILGTLSGGQVVGAVERQIAKVEYDNQAIYSQATYDISDEFRATLGLRYTVDKVDATTERVTWLGFPGPGLLPGPPAEVKCSLLVASLSDDCRDHTSQKSEAPTGMIGLDYLPNSDVMIYVKYSRGYRQGSVVTAAPDGTQSYEPENVNAYELGAKTSFHGSIPGTFNIALFYNELKDMQLQVGFVPKAGGAPTTAIENAGASTIQGVEMETTLKLIDDLTFNLAYTYLETHLDKLSPAQDLTDSAGNVTWTAVPSVVEGGHLSFSPRHTATTGLSYRFPFPAEIGDVSAGATYTFTSSQISTVGSPYGELPARQLLNLNMGWKSIFGSSFDTSLFVTNALNEEYRSYVAGLYTAAGAEFATVGEPRMMGARIKYTFK